MLKHRLKVVKEKKSVSEFQHEYLEFKLQYLEFSIKIQLNYAWNPLKNTEKAGLPHGKPPLRYYKDTIFSTGKQIVLKSPTRFLNIRT